MDLIVHVVARNLVSGHVKSILAIVSTHNLELCRCSSLVVCSLQN